MRKWLVCVAVVSMVTAMGLTEAGSAAAKTKNPVTLSGKVNNKGKKDISKSSNAKLELEQDDFYFKPTFVKVKPGQKVTITVKNEGSVTHTFTSTALNVDKQISSGKSTKITVTIPSTGAVFQFHCNFHEGMGMKGGFYTTPGAKEGASATQSSTTPTTKSSSGGRYGY
jgi:plastocyanin